MIPIFRCPRVTIRTSLRGQERSNVEHFWIENFGGLSDSPCPCLRPSVQTGCTARIYEADIFHIWMKLTYNGTTKTHI